MKRKIDFSNFKYKRRCPILKEDIEKNLTGDCESSSDEDLSKNPSKKLCKIDENFAHVSNSSDKNVNGEEMYSSKSLLDSCSNDDGESNCSDKSEMRTNSCDSSTSSNLNGVVSFERDDTDYRLGVLKGIFKDVYTDEKLLDAVQDTSGLDHGLSVLLDSSDDERDGEDDLVKLIKQFPGHGKKELKKVLEANNFCLEDAIVAMEIVSSREKKVNPKCRRKKIIDIDDIVNCVVIDDSDADDNNSNVSVNSLSKSRALSKKSSNSRPVTVIDDNTEDISNSAGDDCVWSDDEDDLDMPTAVRVSLLSFLNDADIQELALIRGCSITKAKTICGLRPFNSWGDLFEKICNVKGLGEKFLWECEDFVKERDKMENLMNRCESISKEIRKLFEVKSSTTENASSLVIKKQYVTKEPGIVASGFKLKPYQLTGLNWLIAIHKRGVNGILADEMGLGKTIQAVVFLAYLIEQREGGRHLIIVPTSTYDFRLWTDVNEWIDNECSERVFPHLNILKRSLVHIHRKQKNAADIRGNIIASINNWKRELERWCPSVRCLYYCGSRDERGILRDDVSYCRNDFQVLLTTYKMAISSPPDRSFLKKLEFHYAIFDEAHMLKNIKAQRYQQLLRIKPRRMLMLTGTPIQNNLLELMSLLAFVMPDMFAERIGGIKMLFGDNRATRGEGAFQREKVSQAKRIMEPFVLRRVKKDVLGDSLPEKHEHIIECDLPERQKRIYDKTFASCFKMIHSNDTDKVIAPSRALGLLMELRKAANHPLLIRDYYTDDMLSTMAQNYCKDPYHSDSQVNYVFEDMQVMSDFELSRLCLEERSLKDFHLPHDLIMDNGKFHYLDSVLPEMKKEGDRVLLFNQFTMTMDIVEVYLKTRGYKYLRFDGSTSAGERQGLIDRFNTEEDIFIFILSTKAGGLGINLTSANVVILYDSDYNPHNDKQAEDRCHRLGQTREVNVYRLLCEDTIERTVLNCANDKIKLHEDISGTQNSDKDVRGLLNAVFGSSTTKQEEKK